MALIWLGLVLLVRRGQAASCVVLPPLESSEGEAVGLVMVPGAQIPGEQYHALVREIQAQLPGARLWAGVTKGWLGNFPNPLEIAGAVNDCLQQAEAQDLGGPVYMAGHSLGGIMLETWLADNPDKAAGLVLLGSYLPDLFGNTNNAFPVPVLTAVGELDGLTLSYVLREWRESAAAEAELSAPGRFPVQVIAGVNHGQVVGGDIPSFVTDQDIPSALPDEEALARYAASVTAFITLQSAGLFSAEEVATAEGTMAALRAFTEQFLEPFAAASLLESDGAAVPSSDWLLEGQRILLAASEEELARLEVIDFVVPFDDLGDFKPQVNSSSECEALVTTCCQPQYESSVADANVLYSAKVIKAKFKLEDVVREALCLQPVERRQCMDINIQAFETALSLATEEARQRFELLGTRLVFSEDTVAGWGPGWEFSSGLHYNKINATHTRLHSTSLIAEPDFFIQTAAGMHYCDLLSPFRALEWIYIIGLQGKSL